MPRASMKKEDMMGQFFKEGNVEITDCVCSVYQFPPNSKTGEQSDPFPAIVFRFKQLNEDWSDMDGSEVQDLPIRIGGLDKFRPGNLEDADNEKEDPEDLGDEVGTEGNSIFSEPDGRLGFGWPAMQESLEKAGFKADIIQRVYMPDYVGMKCHFKQVPTGNTYKDRQGNIQDEKRFVCTEINKYPWEKKGKGSKGSKKGSASKESGSDPKEIAVGLFGNLSDKFKSAVKDGSPVKRNVFQLQVSQELVRQGIPVKDQPKVQALLKDDEAVVGLGAETCFVVDLDDQTVTCVYE